MSVVSALVYKYADSIGWEKISRGRKAHASIAGEAGILHGVIDIEINSNDWGLMPNKLQADTEFTLWCSGDIDKGGEKLHFDKELFWAATFINLEHVINLFLPKAYEMLKSATENDFLETWPGPSTQKDIGPSYGGPQPRATKI